MNCCLQCLAPMIALNCLDLIAMDGIRLESMLNVISCHSIFQHLVMNYNSQCLPSTVALKIAFAAVLGFEF